MSERRYLAISIRFMGYWWEFGTPCVLWGKRRTKDDEPRIFHGYTVYPEKAELYSIEEFRHRYRGIDFVKTDKPVEMAIDLCERWNKYDTVLVEYDDYINYCKAEGLPVNKLEAQQ